MVSKVVESQISIPASRSLNSDSHFSNSRRKSDSIKLAATFKVSVAVSKHPKGFIIFRYN